MNEPETSMTCFKSSKTGALSSITAKDHSIYEPCEKPLDILRQDFYHMVSVFGTNVVVLYDKHANEVCKHLIVVDTTTGNAVRLQFDLSDIK